MPLAQAKFAFDRHSTLAFAAHGPKLTLPLPASPRQKATVPNASASFRESCLFKPVSKLRDQALCAISITRRDHKAGFRIAANLFGCASHDFLSKRHSTAVALTGNGPRGEGQGKRNPLPDADGQSKLCQQTTAARNTMEQKETLRNRLPAAIAASGSPSHSVVARW
jgi:hypothetical protein